MDHELGWTKTRLCETETNRSQIQQLLLLPVHLHLPLLDDSLLPPLPSPFIPTNFSSFTPWFSFTHSLLLSDISSPLPDLLIAGIGRWPYRFCELNYQDMNYCNEFEYEKGMKTMVS